MFDNENQFENTELHFFDVDFRRYFYSHFRNKHKNMKEGNEKPHGFQDEGVSKKNINPVPYWPCLQRRVNVEVLEKKIRNFCFRSFN